MKITAITCVKNEGPFLLEWIAFNRIIGVTDFLMTYPPAVGSWNWDAGIGPNGELTLDLAQLTPGERVQFSYTVMVNYTCGTDSYRLCNVGFTTSDWINQMEPGPRGADSGDGLPYEPSCTPDITPEGANLVTVIKDYTAALIQQIQTQAHEHN